MSFIDTLRSFITRIFGYKTIIATDRNQVDEAIHALMSNSRNHTRVIGLDTISIRTARRKTSIAVLQLCDESQCLVFKLTSLRTIPESLYNFLSLPGFTFVGFGIKEATSKLWKEYGFVCKNILEARPSVWRSTLSFNKLNDVMRTMHVPPNKCISYFGDDHGEVNLTEDLIKLAVSNAKAAFAIGYELREPSHGFF